jgi:PAS domain S-box-containing protein
MNLLHRLTLLVLLAVVPLSGVEIYNQYTLYRQRAAELHEQALRLVTLIEGQHALVIDGVNRMLTTLSESQALRDRDMEQCAAMLERILRRYPDHLEIRITDEVGIIRCSTDPAAYGIDISDRLHVRMVLETGKLAIGEHIRLRGSAMDALPFGLRYTDGTDKTAGVITTLIDVRWLERHLLTQPLPPNSVLTVTDRNGIMLARVPEMAGVVGALLPDDQRQLLGRPDRGTVEQPDLDGIPRVIAYAPLITEPQGLFFTVGIDKAAAMRPIDEAFRRALTLIAVTCIASLAAAWWGGRRYIRRPIRKLLTATQRWRTGDMSARARLPDDGSEISALGCAFDAMADDLQDRDREREEAHAAALRIGRILENTADCVVVLDRDWRITFVNSRARALDNRDRDVIGMRLWDAFPEAVDSIFWHQFHRAMADQVAIEFEAFYPALRLWLRVHAFPSPSTLTLFLADITIRKRHDRSLAEAQRERDDLLSQLNSLLENAPVGFAFFDREHRYLRINDRLAAINGLPVEAHLGRSVAEVLQEFGRPVKPILDRVFETGEAIQDFEMTGEMPAQPGVVRSWLVGWYPVKVNDRVVSVGAVVMEITDLRRAEAARRESEERYRAIVDTAVDAMVVIDESGIIQSFNRAAETIFGLMAAEAVGRNVAMLMPDTWRTAHDGFIAAYRGTGQKRIIGVGREVEGLRKDGSVFPLELSIAEWHVEGRRFFTGIMRDITRRKAIDHELRTAKEEAERANLSTSKFLASASHDLRQPVQSLFFFTAALQPHVRDEAGREQLMHLERGIDALKGLIDSLLDVSRLDAGVVKPTIEDFPIGPLLDHIAAGYGPIAAAKGLEWEVVPNPATNPTIVRSDRVLLGRMLRNLIENAVRYTERGGLRVVCRPAGDRLCIEVADTGIGIPADHLPRIWEEFHQVGNPERDRANGLGLGLAIVQRIGHLLGYPIAVRSEAGVGSTFSIKVPLGATPAAPEPVPPLEKPAATAGRRFAVVIDDDNIVRLGLQMLLQEWGFDVLSAGSGEQALTQLRTAEREPDIIIADYRLREGKVGTEAILAIRSLFGCAIPSVILTGETGPECQRDAAMHGLTIAHKPVTPRQLSKALEQHLMPVT